MATETLGARILAAAGEHTRRWLDTDQGYDADIQESWRILAALAARADAAERGVAALGSLVDRLGVVHDDERYKAVWETAHWRRGPYQGPFYTDELAEATEALAAWRASLPRTGRTNTRRWPMATETLGARIADAAAGWSTTGDESGWGSEAAVDAWERLLTLCDSADAAERLAVADVAVDRLSREPETMPALGALGVARMERNEALAAWRAITEGEVVG